MNEPTAQAARKWPGQLIPLPEHAPPVPEGLTREQLVALWCDLYNVGEKLLLAGLRREIGPDGDLQAVYRDWLRRYYDDHDEVWRRWAKKMNELRELRERNGR